MDVIVWALYRLKSAGALFWNHLDDCMIHMGYKTCLVNPDMWMIPKTRNSNGLEYYKYVILYVDDVLAIGDDPEEVLKRLDKYFGLKLGLLAESNIYLSARVKLMALPNSVMSC